MESGNPFVRILHAHANKPPATRRQAVTDDVADVIPFVGTAGLTIEAYTPTRVEAILANNPHVQNHIGGLHAAAIALLAETVTGLVVALNVPDESVPVLRTLDVSFKRRAEAPLRAEATLSDADAQRIRTSSIGKIIAPMTATDASSRAPIKAALQWAWLPKSRMSAA
jgi:acyl-coenzyme A thioesterase PaaI-like protein